MDSLGLRNFLRSRHVKLLIVQTMNLLSKKYITIFHYFSLCNKDDSITKEHIPYIYKQKNKDLINIKGTKEPSVTSTD